MAFTYPVDLRGMDPVVRGRIMVRAYSEQYLGSQGYAESSVEQVDMIDAQLDALEGRDTSNTLGDVKYQASNPTLEALGPSINSSTMANADTAQQTVSCETYYPNWFETCTETSITG